MEQGLYSQVATIRQKDLDNKNKRKVPINIISKVSLQDKYAGSILIMSG